MDCFSKVSNCFTWGGQKLPLEILQYSQKNTRVGVFLIKLLAWRPATPTYYAKYYATILILYHRPPVNIKKALMFSGGSKKEHCPEMC